MCSDVIVIASVGSRDVAQMRLTQDDKVIHTLAPGRSDQPHKATIAFFIPRCLAIFTAQALSHDHLLVRVNMT